MNQVFKINPVKINPVHTFAKKNYQGLICLDPFMGVSINLNGDVGLCSCIYWHPTIVGNILENTLEEILHSELAHKIRNSIRQGTYEYCDESRCGIIINDRLTPLELIDRTDRHNNLPSTYERVTQADVVDMPRYFYIAGDQICNLSCPSCRTSVITEDDERKTVHAQVMETLNQQAFGGSDPRPITVYVSSSGELFASPLTLNFLENFPLDRYPRTEFNFQSNGLLFKKRWHRIEHLQHNIFNVAITADSSRPDVYAKLRRGGKLEDLKESLEFVATLREKLNFKLSLRIIVQKDNADEIEEFFDFAAQYNVTDVEYQRIAFWQQAFDKYDEFVEVDVLEPSHRMYQSTVDALRRVKNKHGDRVVFYHFNLP